MWCIDIVRSESVLAAYRTTWRMTHDIEAFATATERLKHPRPYVPTIDSTRLAIESEEIGAILSRLGQVSMALRASTNSISVDGIGFELQIGDGWTGLVLQWHNRVPDEWPRELHDIVSDLNEMGCDIAGQASKQTDDCES
jgi:hypothetical protein